MCCYYLLCIECNSALIQVLKSSNTTIKRLSMKWSLEIYYIIIIFLVPGTVLSTLQLITLNFPIPGCMYYYSHFGDLEAVNVSLYSPKKKSSSENKFLMTKEIPPYLVFACKSYPWWSCGWSQKLSFHGWSSKWMIICVWTILMTHILPFGLLLQFIT